MPSMSCPRCRCASKISAEGGRSSRSSASWRSISAWALSRGSTVQILVRVDGMPDVLMYADTFRSPELRREVPLGVPDPFLYAERDGVKHIQISSMEIPRRAALGLFELHPGEEFGSDELISSGLSYPEVRAELASRAVRSLGITSALVPETFPLWLADRLRREGVELTVAADFFNDRRRVKSEAELAGIRRAQRAAEAGMDAARDLLRRASTQNGGALEVD